MTRLTSACLIVLLGTGVIFGAESDAEKKARFRQLEKQASEAREKHDFERAAQLLQQAISDGADPRFRFMLAENLLSLRRDKDSLDECRKFLDADDGKSSIEATKARQIICALVLPKLTKDQMDLVDKAAADFKSWEIARWNAESVHLANFITKAEALLKQQPDHLPTWNALGDAYRIKKEYQKASKAYTKFLDGLERLKYPVEREELKNIRVAAVMTKDFATKEENEKQLPALDANDERELTNIKDHLEASRDNRPDILANKAIPLMETFCKKQPGYTPALKMLGDAYYETKQWLKAEDAYLLCLEANDKYGGLVESERKVVAKNRILCDDKIPISDRHLVSAVPWKGADKKIYAMKISPDGKLVAMHGSDNRDQVRLADTANGELLTSIPCSFMHLGQSYAFSGDARQIAVSVKVRGLRKAVELHATDSGKLTNKLEGTDAQGHRLAFSPDGKKLVWSDSESKIMLWDFDSSKASFIQKKVSSIAGPFAFSPKTADIAYTIDKVVWLWDSKTEKALPMPARHLWGVTAMAYTPDGKKLVSASDDSTLIIWDMETKKAVHTLNGHSKKEVLCVAVSPDGNLIASGGNDDSVVLWDANSGKTIVSLLGHSGGVMALWFDPSGRILLSAGGDGIRLWRSQLNNQRP